MQINNPMAYFKPKPPRRFTRSQIKTIRQSALRFAEALQRTARRLYVYDHFHVSAHLLRPPPDEINTTDADE